MNKAEYLIPDLVFNLLLKSVGNSLITSTVYSANTNTMGR